MSESDVALRLVAFAVAGVTGINGTIGALLGHRTTASAGMGAVVGVVPKCFLATANLDLPAISPYKSRR